MTLPEYLKYVLHQPSLGVVNYQLERILAERLATILAEAYKGLNLHHLDKAVEKK